MPRNGAPVKWNCARTRASVNNRPARKTLPAPAGGPAPRWCKCALPYCLLWHRPKQGSRKYKSENLGKHHDWGGSHLTYKSNSTPEGRAAEDGTPEGRAVSVTRELDLSLLCRIWLFGRHLVSLAKIAEVWPPFFLATETPDIALEYTSREIWSE